MSDKNVRRVLQSVQVHRNDAPFYPPIGKKFKFTDAELKDIEKLNPAALEAPTPEEEDEQVVEAPTPVVDENVTRVADTKPKAGGTTAKPKADEGDL